MPFDPQTLKLSPDQSSYSDSEMTNIDLEFSAKFAQRPLVISSAISPDLPMALARTQQLHSKTNSLPTYQYWLYSLHYADSPASQAHCPGLNKESRIIWHRVCPEDSLGWSLRFCSEGDWSLGLIIEKQVLSWIVASHSYLIGLVSDSPGRKKTLSLICLSQVGWKIVLWSEDFEKEWNCLYGSQPIDSTNSR